MQSAFGEFIEGNLQDTSDFAQLKIGEKAFFTFDTADSFLVKVNSGKL